MASVVVIGVDLLAKGSADAASVAQLVSVILLIPTLAVPLWRWWRRLATPVEATSDHVARAKDVLAGLVTEQWRNEAIMRSLDDPDPIPVRWNLTQREEVMDHLANLTGVSPLLIASSDDIDGLVSAFRAMRRRRLVIIGGPGAGKTTLALQLLLGLLATRRDGRADEPLPVLLSVAGWDTTAFPRVQDWLAGQLAEAYPALRARELGPDAPTTLATRGHILPVLDGLDELPEPARAAVITALNRSMGGEDQFVLTSRTHEFSHAVGAAKDVLTSAAVIESLPVDPMAAAAYLKRCLPVHPGPVWEQIMTGLSTPKPHAGAMTSLAEITASPLGLWLLRAAYITPGADATPLLDPERFSNTATLRAHLFDRLIPALVDARPPSDDRAGLFRPRRRHGPAQVRHWLGYLAYHLTLVGSRTIGTRDFAWWQLARTTQTVTSRTRVVRDHTGALTVDLTFSLTAGTVFGTTIGIVLGIALGIDIGTTEGVTTGVAAGIGYAIFAGLMEGLVIGGLASSWREDSPGVASLRARRRPLPLRRIFGPGLVSGLTAGIFGGLNAGLVFGIVAAFVFGLLAWVEVPTLGGRTSTPPASWRADRTLNLVRTATVWLGSSLIFGISAGISGGLATGLSVGIAAGTALGLPAGLTISNHRAWPAYLVATYRLALAGRLPRRLMPFLDDAHRLGLLRAVGPIYQFRHAELHDHLAETHQPHAMKNRQLLI